MSTGTPSTHEARPGGARPVQERVPATQAPASAPRENTSSVLRRQWWLPVLLCPLGALLGVGVANVTPTTYTAETRVAIGKGSLTSQAIPGYALAVQQLADTYARWVNNTTVDGVEIVSSNIPESGIVRIEAKGPSRAKALEQARATADALTKQVNAPKPGNDPAQVIKDFTAASSKAGALDTQVEAANQRHQQLVGNGASTARINESAAALNKLKEQQSVARVQAEALSDKYRAVEGDMTNAIDLVVVREAAIQGSDVGPKMQRYGFAGFVLGALLSYFLARRNRARSTRPEGGAAK